MRKNALNVVIFMFLAGAMFFLWQYADKNWIPKKEEKQKETVDELLKKEEEELQKKAAEAKRIASERLNSQVAVGSGLVEARYLVPPKPSAPPKATPPKPVVPPPEPPTLIALGDDTFYLRVLLTTQGGGVQQVVLPRFGQADRLGREVMEKDANGHPTKTPVPLYLIPGVPQPHGKYLREEYHVPELKPGKVADPSLLAEPSFTIFHYATSEDKHPDPRLGEINWKVVSQELPQGGEHKVIFEAELGEPYFIKLRKTYTLSPTDYHIGMRIDIEKLKVPGAAKGKGVLRLQMTGPRGLPIEGEWYTSIYRNALIGWTDNKGRPERQLEDSASIGAKRGGEARTRGDTRFKYMLVTNQYFASGVAINDRAKEEGAVVDPWAYVRATTELPFGVQQNPNVPHFDDITVRAASEPIDLEPGQTLAHSYLLYNGPSKVRLLKLMPADRGAVDPALVDRYADSLTLRTITDYRSDNLLGRFASFIYWTDLVIVFTNLMHWLLAVIHSVIPVWALSIVVLTVMVRLMLFYPSRKQTAMSMKMMEVQKKLQPEFDKLYEKYKDDLHTYNREKTRLMMQNGANPFAAMGGCLLLLAQMPIMMGLYFCLQESVFFRLDSFLWINNLAAPDMLVWWTEHIPYISTPEDIGSFIYLGPYFNLLPVLAVSLMLYQQSKMMPPSTDPQAEQQRMMMKIMMVMMAFFFYKVAAGLALYFIVSTGWGIIERQFIPKPKINLGGDGDGKTADAKPQAGSPNGKLNTADAVAAAQQKSKGLLTRLREALQKRLEEMQKSADEQSKRQIRNDPNRPGGANQPPTPGSPSPENQPRRDKKKRRK